MKNEQARALPSFSHSPQSKQEVEKANKTVHRARNILEYSRRSWKINIILLEEVAERRIDQQNPLMRLVETFQFISLIIPLVKLPSCMITDNLSINLLNIISFATSSLSHHFPILSFYQNGIF